MSVLARPRPEAAAGPRPAGSGSPHEGLSTAEAEGRLARQGTDLLILSTMVFASIALMQMAVALQCRATPASLLAIRPLSNRLLDAALLLELVALATFMYAPPVYHILGQHPLTPTDPRPVDPDPGLPMAPALRRGDPQAGHPPAHLGLSTPRRYRSGDGAAGLAHDRGGVERLVPADHRGHAELPRPLAAGRRGDVTDQAQQVREVLRPLADQATVAVLDHLRDDAGLQRDHRGAACQCLDHDEARRLRSEEHTSELQSRGHLVCRLLLEKKKNINY